jgi:hypothetical protein
MTVLEVANRDAALREWLSQAHGDRLLLTRDGVPAAIVTSVDGLDLEEIATASDPEFWRLINQRRQEPVVSLQEARQALGL